MGLSTTLLDRWESATYADAPALTIAGTDRSWLEVADRMRRAAGWLRGQGVAPGGVIALRLPKHPAFLDLLLGAWSQGIACVLLHPGSTPAEVAARLEGTRATLVLHDPEGASDGIAASEAVDPLDVPWDAVAVILHTSGTTGRPKGVPLTHRNVLAGVQALHDAWRWSPSDVLVHALPLFHVHGLFVAQLGALYAGARTVWIEPFSAGAVLDALEGLRGAGAPRGVLMGVPTHYTRLLEAGIGDRDVSGVRLFTSGSAPLPASVHQAFEAATGHRILERYGMTEIGIVLANPYDDRRAGSVGRPLAGVELRIADDADRPVPEGAVGQIQIRGPSVFSGYLNDARATSAALVDGWMRTGDRGTLDGDGFVRIVGRTSDLIISGGMNVWPAEVEAALADAPGVREIAVFGVPDADLGERVAAAVVADGPWDPLALGRVARERLAAYKVPRRWHRVESLPRNAMGKVQKAVLQRDHAVTVRDGTLADLDGIVARNLALCEETEDFRLDPAVLRAGVARALSGTVGARYLVAERDGEVAGQLMLTTEWSDWRDAEVWWIQSVYVAPAHRRAGVYQALHDAAVARAKARGAAGLRLYVETRNTAAMRAYERVGMSGEHYRTYEQMFGDVRR